MRSQTKIKMFTIFFIRSALRCHFRRGGGGVVKTRDRGGGHQGPVDQLVVSVVT